MKISTVSCLLAALSSTSSVFALSNQGTPVGAIPEAELVGEDSIAPRQDAGNDNLGTTLAASQYPTVTTQWYATKINGVVTYLSDVYTQTFAAVPDQGPSPGVGSIGYGTHTKEKRDTIPIETGIAGRLRI